MLTATQTDALIHFAATAMFAVLLLVAVFLGYYAYVAMSGDPGGALIDGITWALVRQQSALGLLGAAATAVPALALGLANTPEGVISRRGWTYVVILTITGTVATLTNFVFDPKDVNLGSTATPTMADATALSISAFAVTYLAAILGLKRLASPVPATAKPAPPKADPPPATPAIQSVAPPPEVGDKS